MFLECRTASFSVDRGLYSTAKAASSCIVSETVCNVSIPDGWPSGLRHRS